MTENDKQGWFIVLHPSCNDRKSILEKGSKGGSSAGSNGLNFLGHFAPPIKGYKAIQRLSITF